MSQSGDPERHDPDRLVELKEQVDRLNGQILNLTERVARLEEDNRWLKKQFEELNKQVGDMNRRTWIILTSILTTMGGVIAILIRLAIIH